MASWSRTFQSASRPTIQSPARMVEKAAQAVTPRKGVPVGLIVGPAVGAVALLAAVWFLPELVRYVKIELM
jgi:hypothetical protein